MSINNDLRLLIKSKYPLVFFESVDEQASLEQLRLLAGQLNLVFFRWSLTTGLVRAVNDSPYYETKDPVKMLGTVQELLRADTARPSLFVLKDFEKYLSDAVTLRLFKDALNQVQNTPNTFVIVSPQYQLPVDVQAQSAHILGGYPAEDEIRLILRQILDEIKTRNEAVRVVLDVADFDHLISALKGLTVQQIRNVINQCAADDGCVNIKDIKTIESCKKKIFDQEGLLELCLTEDKSNIAGFYSLKRWVNERSQSFGRQINPLLPSPKGLMLMGVQGCGKSFAVKVIAAEFGLPLYRLDLSRLYSKYIGETEQNLRKALAVAEQLSPMCLWIDEIEKGFASSGGDVDGGVSQRILGGFLTWMQERKPGCFLAATANNISLLPPEFLRKGRFDEVFFVDLPDEAARQAIFAIHLKKRGFNPDLFDCRLLAGHSPDFSGAEIEQSLIAALYRSASQKEHINTAHILEQLASTKPLAVVKQEEVSALRAWAAERTIPV